MRRVYCPILPVIIRVENLIYNYSTSGSKLSIRDDKVVIARAAAEEVLGKDNRIISVSTSYGDGENSSYRLTSNGFEGESKSTWFSVSADVALRGEGEARPSSYWYDSALFYDKLVKSGIGATALERALRKLGQRRWLPANIRWW